jgi:CRISPR/Cas system CMR subunit Cmr4 (Cas7 group RAMP superfamily)
MSHIGQRRTVWRVTLETTSCFTIGTGGGDDVRDSICVTDANGFPAIPGSSIAGVLRSALAASHVEGDEGSLVRSVFGYVDGDVGQASRLEVGWGQVHDGRNKVVPLRRPGGRSSSDEVLEFLRAGVTRDHVRINGDGVVDGRGKFDETLVPVGARFTFELQLVDGSDEEERAIVDALRNEQLRFGGRTRMGHGRMKTVALLGRRFDFAKPADVQAWLALPARLEQPSGLPAWPAATTAGATGLSTFHLELQPEDYWLVGGGEPLPRFDLQRGTTKKTADMVPVTQRVIRWKNDEASIGDDAVEAVLPATAVKGAVRHRFLYLARCAGLGGSADAPDAAALVDELFGVIQSSDGDDDGASREGAHAGRVFFSDGRLELEAAGDGALEHVSIDRFTSAPMNGMLFNEAPRFRTKKRLRIDVVVDLRGLDPRAWRLLKDAIDDLCKGRLALGGGSNRGHGYFRGDFVLGDGSHGEAV